MKLRKRPSLILLIVVSAGLSAAASKKWIENKPFEEWTKKNVDWMLKKSPWTQTHTYMPYHVSGASRSSSRSRSRSGSGDSDPSQSRMNPRVYFRAQWFSARPVRMGIANRILQVNPQVDRDELESFVWEPSPDAILSVVLDSNREGRRTARKLARLMSRLDFDHLLESTMLVTKSGKKVRLKQFLPPTPDGTGAKFLFSRTLEDGRPLLEAGDREVRFITKFSLGNEDIRINLRYKINKMLYQGELEY